METRKRGRRFVKEKSIRINLTIDKNNMDLVDLCCAKRNMNVSELFRTFAREYAMNVLKMNLNDFYYMKSNKEQGNTSSIFEDKKLSPEKTLSDEEQAIELERLKEARRLKKLGDTND